MDFVVVKKENCEVKFPTHLTGKVHVSPKTNCSLVFTRSKLSKPIQPTLQSTGFIFCNSREFQDEYNPLHDPPLESFFKRKVHLNQLRKNNFITDDNEVICSVKDFNDYRKYLHRRKLEAEAKAGENDECRLKLSKLLFGKLQRKKMKKFDEMYRTKNVGSDASWRATNPLGFTNIIKLKHKKLEQEQRRRIEKFKTAIEKYNERIKLIQQKQHLRKNQFSQRAIYRDLEIKKKQIFVNEMQRKHQVETKKQISARDKVLRGKFSKKCTERPKKVNLIVKCPVEV